MPVNDEAAETLVVREGDGVNVGGAICVCAAVANFAGVGIGVRADVGVGVRVEVGVGEGVGVLVGVGVGVLVGRGVAVGVGVGVLVGRDVAVGVGVRVDVGPSEWARRVALRFLILRQRTTERDIVGVRAGKGVTSRLGEGTFARETGEASRTLKLNSTSKKA